LNMPALLGMLGVPVLMLSVLSSIDVLFTPTINYIPEKQVVGSRSCTQVITFYTPIYGVNVR
jgi:hypothetical protein